MNMLDKVIYAIKSKDLIKPNDTVVIGVSGGADSICLLYILNKLKNKLKITLHIAHLNHMLRKESTKESNFVKSIAKKLNIPVTIGRINVSKNLNGLSLEEAARNARFVFLIKVANKLKAKRIALAHHFDDQVETVLMRILRGTGLYGLSGIVPKRKMGKIDIVRPLLNIKRREIEAYLNKRRINFCTDKTNADETYFRNRIRHKLLPLLKKEYNKNIEEVLFNLAQNAATDYDYLKVAAGRAQGSDGNRLNLDKLFRMHPSLLRIKLRNSISCLQGDTRRITFKHIQELEDLIFNRPTGSIVDLPKGISVLKKSKTIYFYLR
jgi:tRNA(Ile)-lysidine synthase